jgi:cyclic dehypoxanthinyl futalosine synthase
MGITRKDALDCFQSDDLIGIGMEADAVRRRLHPEGVVSYTIDGRIDYTPAANGAGSDPIFAKISEIIAKGGTAITLQGEVTSAHSITWFDTLFRTIKQRFPALWLHSLSATEILAIAKLANSSLQDTIARLHEAGLDSIPGNDAGILDDTVQRQSKAEDWIAVHRARNADDSSDGLRRRRNLRTSIESSGRYTTTSRRNRWICLVHTIKFCTEELGDQRV